MKRYFLLMAVVILFAVAANADVGDYTWGTGGNSMTQGGAWDCPLMIWNGSDFVDPAGNSIVWPGLDIELWIEAECSAAWSGYEVDIVRTDDYSNFVLVFDGSSSCNLPIFVVTEAPGGADTLDRLPFVSAVPGSGVSSADPIALQWQYSIDGAAWAPMDECLAGYRFMVPACDHGLRIRCIGTVPYHQAPGYYRLGGTDDYSICPLEMM